MRILFFEPHITGHRIEYLNHLIDYIQNNPSDHQYIFVVHSGFVPAGLTAGLIIDPLPDSVRADLRVDPKGNNLLIRSIKTFKLADTYAKKHTADHVCFLNFNDVQFALGLFRPKYSVSGILYKPFASPEHHNLSNWLNYRRKRFQTWLFTRNHQIKSIFVLNDKMAADFLNRSFNTQIFEMLPDPVPVLTPDPSFNLREKFNIESHRKIFLHIGSLTRRKGTLGILEAMKYLGEDELDKFSLVILGQADMEVDSAIRTYPPQPLPRPGRGQGGGYVSLIYQNKFLTPAIFKSCIDQCDLLLAPYRYNESSSGIAGHAIAAGKPLLGVRKGLLGETIAEHGKGIFIQEATPAEISDGIRRALAVEIKASISRRYLEQHTGAIFAGNLLKTITG